MLETVSDLGLLLEMTLRTAMVVSCYEHKGKSKSNIVCLCRLQWLCLLSVGDLTAMLVFVKCRRSESKCFFRSYVFADCGHEDNRKSKSNIVCLCGLQSLCLLSVGDLKVNVSKGRMSLRTAMVVSCYEQKGKSKSNIVCLCRLQWLCLLSVGDLTAMIVFVKCRR